VKILDRTPTAPRRANSGEQNAFLKRLSEMLDKTQARLAALQSADYELRVMTIRTHKVRAHTRKQFTRPYLAKIRQRRRAVGPVV